MNESLEILTSHALATLPDSMAARKKLLRAVSNLIAGGHRDYRTVLSMLASLALHEKQQSRLGFRIRPAKKPKRPGRHGGGSQ